MAESVSEAQLEQWGKEEPCFLMLRFLWLSCRAEDDEHKSERIDLFLKHYRECSSCWQRVLIVAEQSQDPLKRQVHFNLHQLSLLEYMRHEGGDFDIQETEDGLYVRMKYPEYVEAPWSGGELFLAASPRGRSRLTFDLRDEATFKDPRVVLQKMDEIASFEVKDFDRPGGEPIQWWTIWGERPAAVEVRWQGQVTEIATDWTTYPRYQPLLRRMQVKDSRIADESRRSRRDQTVADEVLLLRTLLMDYDGRSYFSGFARATGGFRRIDALRKEGRDLLHRAESIDEDPEQEHDRTNQRRDLLAKRDRLLPQLTDQEKRVLVGLCGDDEPTAIAVGRRLGLRRDSVSRILGRIRKKAVQLT